LISLNHSKNKVIWTYCVEEFRINREEEMERDTKSSHKRQR